MSSIEVEDTPRNSDKDPRYNREPGIVQVPGSNLAKEMSKFEQFPSGWGTPGNRYVFREFPVMLYRAEHWNGKPYCMAPDPNRLEYTSLDEYKRKLELARQFTERCQRIVQNEQEATRAMEDGWRSSPQEAVDYLLAKDRDIANATAERNWDDRRMSEKARAEADAAVAEVGGEHMPEIPAKPVRRRRKVTTRRRKSE